MIKNNGKKASYDNSSVSSDNSVSEYEIFKSRVANAVLDYMEAQSDTDLLECLERASIFLTNISLQMENVFDNQNKAFQDQNDVFENGCDLFSMNKQSSSNTIH